MLQMLRQFTNSRDIHLPLRHLHKLTKMSCLPQQVQPQNGLTDPIDGDPEPRKPNPQATITPIPADQPDAIQLATAQLRAHRVIALPTDTIYGLACCANSESAIRRLYAIKGREQTKAVAICVARIADVRHWGRAEHLPDALLHSLLPGPVTLVLAKRPEHLRNRHLNPGFHKIGIRIPDSEFIRKVCAAYALPIALTSANRSAAQSTLNVQEFEALWPALAAVFDGGAVGLTEEQRAGSTIVDLSERDECSVVRLGVAAAETLRVIRSFGIRVVGDT